MRKIFALTGLLLSLAAAKPVPPDDAVVGPADASGAWRGQAVAACIDRLHAVPALSPDTLESICGCAANEAIEANGAGALPPVEAGQLPSALRSQMIMCTSRVQSDRVGDVMRATMTMAQTPPPVTAVPPRDVKPPDVAPPVQSDANEAGGGFWDWIRSFSLPDWLTGASSLLWVALGIFVFGLLILRVRGRDPRKDLVAPPSSMRRGVPQPPRRPDLPR
jgi:hypothetical protein